MASVNGWAYIHVDDLAELVAVAVEGESLGHEVIYAAAADNIAGRPLAELVADADWPRVPEVRHTSRADASGVDCTKAAKLFGWTPRISWRDV
jgi:nucleoside-diphosphate-sugar epimerase